ELDEFAVGLAALRRRHRPRRGLAALRLAPAGGAVPQVVEIGGESVGADAIGPAADLELGHPPLDANLPGRPAGAGADLAGEDFPGFGVVRPSLDHVIQVPSHRWPPPDSIRLPRRLEQSGSDRLLSSIIVLVSDS